jgi:predicted O-methyltransferase YrrM
MDQAEATFDKLQSQYPDRIIKHKMSSLEAAQLFKDGSLDAVYIDADHSYPSAREDILTWKPKVRPGGILSGHDYGRCHIGVKLAVDEILGSPDKKFSDSSWAKVI